jgi:cysteine synthase A
MLYESVAHAIGKTPLVSLSRIVSNHKLQGRLIAKLEHLNPGSSKKDRVAKRMILDAYETGKLRKGQPVVELTSGNTGIGLAIVCSCFGHPFTAVMSKGNSIERARMMKALGANVVLVEQALGSKPGYVSGEDLKLVQNEAERLVSELGGFRADQFNLLANEDAHYTETGPEIWSEFRPRAFVDVGVSL